MIKYQGILHASVIVSDVEQALAFYCDMLNMEIDPNRPELGYPGAWINIGAHQQIHLLQVDNPDPTDNRPPHGGRDRHTALGIDSITPLLEKLDAHHVPYTLSKSGRQALFCRDPDGNTLEFIASS
jgi:glyoxylase I family protein